MKRVVAIFKRHMLVIQLLMCFITTIPVGAQPNAPKVVPPSPEASALFRFQDYPMDYSTGLPAVSIPVYEVKSGSLSVPISLSYHASGRRVMDEDGPVALGWSLNAGGIISRTIYGNADFGIPATGTVLFPNPFRVTGFTGGGNPLTTTDLYYFEKLTHYDNPGNNINNIPWTESEYDVFSYSFGSNSGKFVFRDANNVKTPVLLPFKPYIIKPYYTVNGLTSIDITDDKGVLYQFTAAEYTSGAAASLENNNATTSLSLTKIVSADKTDIITFQYTGFFKWTQSFSQTRTWKTDWVYSPQHVPSMDDLKDVENSPSGMYYVQRLKEIDFKQGKVVFNLVSGTDKIDNIQVISNNTVIKTVQLNRSILDGLTDGGTSLNNLQASQVSNKLDNLVFKDAGGTPIENYSMEYYPTVFNGSTKINPRHCDYWGYYNASGVANMIPTYMVPSKLVPAGTSITGGYFNRQPNLSALKSGMLSKIIYPTGGSTSFIYENNKYADPSNSAGVDGPGLRVAQIITTDNNGNNMYKTYKYGTGESGYGLLDLKPDMTSMGSFIDMVYFGPGNNVWSSGFQPTDDGTYSIFTFTSGFNSNLSALASRPVIYTEVAEYLGTTTSNVGKILYKYDYNAWMPITMPVFSWQPIVRQHIYNWNYWNNPSLLTKTDYKVTTSGTSLNYTTRKLTTNTYSITTLPDVVGLHVQRLQSMPQSGIGIQCACPVEVSAIGNYEHSNLSPPINIYASSEYHILAGAKNLGSTTEIIYNEDGSTSTNAVNYAYNSKQYVSQTTKAAADGNSIVNTITYPFDYPTNTLLTQMAAAPLNMLDYPVEQTELKNSIPIKSTRTNYLNYGTGVPRIYPQTVDFKKGSNAYETRLRYYGYDTDGNPLSVSKENDLVSSYIWGYNNSYPIAEVKNAKSNEIFFNSFEEGSGWDANLTAYDNTKSHCGRYSGRIDKASAGELVSLGSKWLTVSLTAATKYRYSGWVYSNGPSTEFYLVMKRAGETGAYTYIDAITNHTVNQWVFVEKEFLVPADVTQINMRIDNNGGGTTWFDDMRISPSASFMTTYTYDVLVGMTSSTDLNNLSSFYEYDLFGRLKLIRDINGHIIKTFSYQNQSATP